MPTPVGAATAAQFPTSPAAPTGEPGEVNQDMFLKLMVAQLKYQNPLEPTDGAQFMAQTAQFTMVETLKELATSQESSLRWTRMSAAQGLVGQHVTATDPVTGADITGPVTGLRATTDGPILIVDANGTDVEVALESVTGTTAGATR